MKLTLLLLILTLTACAHNPRPWTPAEKALLVTSTLAAAADYYTSERIMDRGGRELNPIIGEYPSDAKLGFYMLGTQTLTVIISHYISCLRKPLLGFKTVVNTGFAIRNDRQN